jgi:hypothetical protein
VIVVRAVRRRRGAGGAGTGRTGFDNAGMPSSPQPLDPLPAPKPPDAPARGRLAPGNRIVGLVLVAALLAAAVGWWPSRHASVPSTPAPLPVNPWAARLAQASAVAEAAPVVPAASAPGSALGGDFELCGAGRGDKAWILATKARTQADWRERGQLALAGALLAGDDPLDRAFGLTWQELARRDRLQAQAETAFLDAHPDCKGRLFEQGCMPTTPSLDAEAGPTVNALAAEASRSDDARIHALAHKLCSVARTPPPACEALPVAQWARLDPGSAWPVLAGGTAGLETPEDLLHRLAHSQRFTPPLADAAPRLLAHLPPGSTALHRAMVLGQWTVFDMSTLPLNRLGALMQACSPRALQDANMRQLCATVAERFASGATDLMVLTMGLKLGERLAWPAERLQALRDEKEALMVASLERFASFADETQDAGAWSCERAQAFQDSLHDQLVLGERAAGLQAIAQSGRTVAALAALAPRAPTEPASAAPAASLAGASAP